MYFLAFVYLLILSFINLLIIYLFTYSFKYSLASRHVVNVFKILKVLIPSSQRYILSLICECLVTRPRSL